MRIKFQVFGLIAATTVPLLGVAGYLIAESYAENRAKSLESMATLAGYAAGEMHELAANAEAMLAVVAARGPVRALDASRCDVSLSILLDADRARANIAFADGKGRIICSASPLPDGTPLDVNDTDWFARTMAEDRFVVSRPRVGRITGKLVVVFAYPIRDESGMPSGVAILPHELAHLRPVPDSTVLPAGATVTVFDDLGTMIARQPDSVSVGRNISDQPAVRAALAGGDGVSIGGAAGGREIAFGYRQIASLGWTVIATIPIDLAIAQARTDALRAAVIVAFVLSIVLSLGALLVRRITRPIEEIAAASRRVAAGELDARMAIPAQQEFAFVARQFNAMLDSRRLTERRFADLLESVPDGMLLVDRAGAIRFANAQIEKMFSYEQSELTGHTVERLIPDRLRARHAVHRTTYDRAPVTRPMGRDLKLLARRKDGSEFSVEISLSPMTTPDGPMTCCAVRDVTERQATEQRIKHLNRTYSTLSRTNQAITQISDRRKLLDEVCRIAVEHGQLALAWIGFVDDATGLVVPEAHFGPAESYLSGLVISTDPTQAEGKGPSGRAIREGRPEIAGDLMDDPRSVRWRDAARAAGLRSSAALPLMLDGKVAGTLSLYACEPHFFDDPELMKLLGEMAGDVSFALESLKRESAHCESEERFRQIAENIREVFWLTDPSKGEMLYISPGYEAVWGRSTADLYASPKTWLDAIHPDDQARVLEAALTKQVSGEYDEDYRILRPNGDVRWIHDRAFPVRDASGVVYRVAGIAEDVTEHKLAQAQLLQVQKMEALGSLAGGIAHDFNNLLLPITVLTEMTKDALPIDNPVQENLASVLEAAEQAALLVKQILTFGRRNEVQLMPLNIAECVKEALTLLRNILPTTITVVEEIDEGAGTVVADRAQLQSVILNLSSNAAHAMEGKVGRLTVRIESVVADAGLAARCDTIPEGRPLALLTVADSGSGMDRATMQKIFNPFFTTKPVGEGTGLGLAMVHGIVEALGGAIEVDSEIDVGTTFRIYLPLQSQSASSTSSSRAMDGNSISSPATA